MVDVLEVATDKTVSPVHIPLELSVEESNKC
jgi:hypothetical protein